MEFRSGASPKNSTTKPVDSRRLRARAILWDSSDSCCIPQAYRAYLARASRSAFCNYFVSTIMMCDFPHCKQGT